MNSLQQSQIHESCKLALPEGLKDLMSDISREVLRAQPHNLYNFIAKYLESLLEVREALSIACRICNETCECTCEPELKNELIEIGLDEENLDKAVKIIQEHLKIGSVNEPSLFIKLTKKTSIDEFYIPTIQEAIQRAFKRRQLKNVKTKYLQNDHYDEAIKAVQNTMQVYERKTKTEDSYVSTHLKPCIKHLSSTSLTGACEKFKTPATYHMNNKPQSPEEDLKVTSTANNENEFHIIDNKVDMNSETSDENYIASDISDDVDDFNNDSANDETDHLEYINEIKKEDINEEIIINEEYDEMIESDNDSIISSIHESLPNSDNSVEDDM